MSSFGFHAEHAREMKPRRRSRPSDSGDSYGSRPDPNTMGLNPPGSNVQINYNRRREVPGSSSVDRNMHSQQPRRQDNFRNMHMATQDPVGLNDMSGGIHGRNRNMPLKRRTAIPTRGTAGTAMDDINTGEDDEDIQMVDEEMELPVSQPQRNNNRGVKIQTKPANLKLKEKEKESNEDYKLLQESIDKLRVELQREKLARKKLDVSIKSNASEIAEFRRENEGAPIDDLRREMDDYQRSISQKMNEIVKTVQEQIDVLISEIDDLKNVVEENPKSGATENTSEAIDQLRHDMDDALSKFHEMLFWNFGQVVHEDGADVMDPETHEVFATKPHGSWILLHAPMTSKGDEIYSACRIVDDSTGESRMGVTCLMKSSEDIIISNFQEVPSGK